MNTNSAALASAALAVLALNAPCAAQTTHMNMPEGSKDVYLSLAMGNTWESEGASERRTFAVPLISAQFANGVFIDMNTIGMHLSDSPVMPWGVQFSPTTSRVTTRTAAGFESKRRFTPEVGAYLNYQVAHELFLSSGLMYGGSSDHRGLRLRFGASSWMPVAEHHSLGIDLQVRLANRSALQADFAVTDVQAGPGIALYEVRSGVRDSGISAGWHWQMANKYSLRTMLRYERLHGSAAASPRIERTAGVTALSVLTYRY